jgi:hypothetical protein
LVERKEPNLIDGSVCYSVLTRETAWDDYWEL